MQSTVEVSDDGNDAITPLTRLLTDEQIATFLQDGVLVVDDLLSPTEVQDALQNGLARTLRQQANVDVNDLYHTGRNLQRLSSTNGSGGVLDVFYDAWKINIALNPILFAWTRQLWKAAGYCCHSQGGECSWNDDLNNQDEQCKWHPYGKFDSNMEQGFAYFDRICYRLPTRLAEELGEEEFATQSTLDDGTNMHHPGGQKKKKKRAALQRGLTPHLDCCPDTYYDDDDPTTSSNNKTKWRPIQCFVSLTDNLEANTGGFEAAKGFHRNFREWARNRPYTVVRKKKKKKNSRSDRSCRTASSSIKQNGNHDAEDDEDVVTSFPAPCMGEYTVSPECESLLASRSTLLKMMNLAYCRTVRIG
jgi:hypothetical protein